ncbi:Pimeloyl-ACP methyl ester carboxylesterase [Shimia gijangensis]|uniref:Pimeloyl-ACP methyl ester carboxylesterase n=1 Tax=Shimia gijangensis TaxID=1470563 RepID=A0A1M6CSY2_9RHOB|nr:alpha/beta hydrolase [Shimia gijangensis]SHI64080.1 Pimeloyl-ACP methyl ester carboxylesterase [Shimia gijangensis]
MQITANGITLEVEVHGPDQGTPLVLIRGLGSQLIHWPQNLVQGLVDRGYRTVIFDNRDVGKSQRCPDNQVSDDPDVIIECLANKTPFPLAYTLSDMAQDVIGLMDALGIAAAHVFGVSMGGAIAQLLCLNHPERLLSATIVMTAASFAADSNDTPTLLSLLLSRPVDRDTYIDGWVQEHSNHGSPGYPMPEADIRAEAALAWSRGVDADGINRQLMALMRSQDTRTSLTEVDLPCQVIHGVEDALIPVARGAEIAGLIPNCDYHALEGMGHIITPALAPQIVDTVDGFIRRRGL